jgi:acylphosphatase
MSVSEEPQLVWRIVVEGHVQGVGYRHFARRIALRFGVAGWVRNRRDGAVEMLVAGPAERLEAALAELRRGPLGAHVLDFRIVSVNETERPIGFEIRGTL